MKNNFIKKLKEMNISKKSWEFIEKHKFTIFFMIITFISLIIRYLFIEYQSSDYDACLEPWFNTIKENGGFKALKMDIGNYNSPYMQILAILTYLPLKPLLSIKMVSIIFDYVCAFIVMQFVYVLEKRNSKTKFKELIVYFSIIFLPTVILNSSCWGQADSIYTAFVLASILNLVKEKYTKAFIYLGIAFSFKLQTVFILPLYIFIYLNKKKFSIFDFFIIPLVDLILSLPSIIAGKSIIDCWNIYIGQVGENNGYLEMNFPNIYSLIFPKDNIFVISPGDYFERIGLFITIGIFAIMTFVVIYKKINFNKEQIIEFGLWSIMVATFFLPHMHDRYLFMADILSIVYFLCNKKKIYIPIGVSAVSLYTYSNFLFGGNNIPVEYISIIFAILIFTITKDIYIKYIDEK